MRLKSLNDANPFLAVYLRPYLGGVVFAIFCSLLVALVSAAMVMLIGPGIQILIERPDAQHLVPLTVLFGARIAGFIAQGWHIAAITATDLIRFLPMGILILSMCKAVLSVVQTFVWERLSELVSRDMRREIVRHFVYQDPNSRFLKSTAQMEADISAIVSTDIKFMREYIVHYYGGLPRELLQVVFQAVTLFLLSPKLLAFFVVGILPAGLVVRILGKKIRQRSSKALENYSVLTEWIQRRLLGIETIKHYGTEGIEETKFKQLTLELFHRFNAAARAKARSGPLLEMVGIIAMILVLFLALRDVFNRDLTAAVAISFFASLALLTQSAAIVGRYFNTNREGVAAIERIMAVFRGLVANHQETLKRTYGEGDWMVQCHDLSVQYPGAVESALTNFTYRFLPGRTYCIVGPSGAGKSTLLKLLLGIKAPTSGEIVYNASLAKSSGIGYMPQAVELMSASIAENIGYPDPAVDNDRVQAALRKVALFDFVGQLKDGIQTVIGPRGLELSGGQKQRILLARLFYHDFPLIIFDEGTSALDPETEALVYREFKRMTGDGKTIIIVSHRPSGAKFAQDVLAFENGRLISQSV